MIRVTHNPVGTPVLRPFSVFAARFMVAVLAASVVVLLALHTLAPGSAATAPPANDDSAATSQGAPQPPTYFSGKPY